MLALHCEEGDLRLIGGSTVNQGMVEVCKNETWGNICSTNRQWGQPEAAVTCRQLGFSQHGIRGLIKSTHKIDQLYCIFFFIIQLL